MKNIYLVTGATGFIGSYLVRTLIEQKRTVHIICRNNTNWRLSDIKDKTILHRCDLLNKSIFKIIHKIKPDYIFHFAAYGSLPNESDINKLIDINIKGAMNLINAIKQNPFKLFINTGSSSEYGIKEKPMKETDIANPINDYGISKLTATLIFQKEAKINNLPIINFRIFSAYGPYEHDSRLIPYIILNQLKNNKTNLSSPSFVRDFVYVKDIANAYIKATAIKIEPGEIFNVGSGHQHSIQEVYKIISKITDSVSPVLWKTKQKQERQVEPKIWEADISKAKSILHWQPEYSLEQGIYKTVQWFKQNFNLYE